MKHLSDLKLTLLSILAVFALSGGGLATIAAWQTNLTVGDVTVASGDGWGKPVVLAKFTQISAGGSHTVAIDTDGNAWAWGDNSSGQLGDGTTNNSSTPVQVAGGHKFRQIVAGKSHTVAIDSNGDTWAWGNNRNGQLGDGTTTKRNTPIQVVGGHRFTQISAGYAHTVAIDTNGDTWAWGYNGHGQLGDGTYKQKHLPVQVAGGHKFTQIAVGYNHTVAIDTNGDTWAWGANNYGQAGNGTAGSREFTPVKVSGGHKFTQIFSGSSYTVAIDKNGDTWAWGSNRIGQLGNGKTDDKELIPVKVSGGHKFTQIFPGYAHTVAIDTNGGTWAWGRNDKGQFGNGTTTNSPAPIQVLGDHRFTRIAAGKEHMVAIGTAGDTWAWGNNYSGQLGDGTTTNSPIPVKVLAPANP